MGKFSPAETVKDLHIRTLTRGYWLGAGLTLLGMFVVLGFQLYYTLSKDLPPSLSILTAVAIVAITVALPHLMSAMALMGKSAQVSGTAIIIVIAGAALVASYHHMNQMFLSTGYSWTAAYLLPLAFDGTAVLGLIFAFGAASKKTRIQFNLDGYEGGSTQQASEAPQIDAEESKAKVTVTEIKKTPKDARKASRTPKAVKAKKVAPPQAPKAIESGELSDNEVKWLERIGNVYKPGMSVNAVKEALYTEYGQRGNQNTVSKLVKIVREGAS